MLLPFILPYILLTSGIPGFGDLLLRLPVNFIPFIYLIPIIGESLGAWIGLVIGLLVPLVLVSLIARLVKIPLLMRNLLCLIFLLFFSPQLLPFYLLAWIVVTVEKGITYYGPMMRRLTKGKFKSDAIPGSLNTSLDHELRQTFNTQGGKVIRLLAE